MSAQDNWTGGRGARRRNGARALVSGQVDYRPAPEGSVEAQAAKPVSCIDCHWSGKTGDLEDLACPECKSEWIARL